MDLPPPTGPLPDLSGPEPDVAPAVDQAAAQGDASEAAVGAALGRVTTAADLHWSRVVGEVGEARARFRPGPDPGTVVAGAKHEARVTEELAPLDRLEAQLDEGSWQWRRLAGEAGRVVAEREGLRLRAAHSPVSGTFWLEVASDPLSVGPTRAQELVDG
jgi:hypothetical protein